MESTETPAERIAGDLALAVREGNFPLPAARELEVAYRVPPATVAAAHARLEANWVRGSGQPPGWRVSPRGVLLAAAAMCRRIDALAGSIPVEPVEVAGHGTVADAGQAARLLAGQFLIGARLPQGADSEYLAAKAEEILSIGARATAVRGGRVIFPWARNPVSDSFPAPAAAALAAPRSAGVRGGRGAPRPGTAITRTPAGPQ